MTVVFLGLGSNMGNKEQQIKDAITFIGDCGKVIKESRLYLTEPVGLSDQDWFLNCVVEIETDIDPKTLLLKVKSIERKLGRKKTIKNGPRPIDIDILFYDNLVIQTKNLVIPHPLVQERLFVLQPMMDLNPGFVHPVLHQTIQVLYDEHPWSEIVTPYK
jgi:2-amino-4-hydroxy-6-hydroxymethyldihydropteridine diphosphokinase